MNATHVIKYPILTEKTTQKIDQGIYTFAVDKKTNKAEVKKVVEFIFDVKVKQVNILNVRKKPKKMGKTSGFKSAYKKAIVTLKNGTIKMFKDEVAQSKQIEQQENLVKEVKETQLSEVEKKAAAKIAAKAEKKLVSEENQEQLAQIKKDEDK